MNLKSWLQRNFRLRHLRRLSQKVLTRLTGSFFPPSLLPRRPLITPEEELAATANDVVTDVKVRHGGREVRVLSSEHVRVDERYADWIARLQQLPPDTKPEDLALAVKGLLGTSNEEQNFFPLAVYLESLPGKEGTAIEWVHYCRASRQPAVDMLLSLTGQQKTPAHIVETSALLIYGRAVAADER